ncbi:hypothetical protein G6L37_00310 [Agrobacterium rubi]|nr:hypothetical protein [Agrobacterium rubi]NTF23831.1 hypothetical protein [Agrobacterium rubi]
MPSHQQSLMVLFVFPAALIAALICQIYWERASNLHSIETSVRAVPFSLSCDADGNLDGADARNCLERGGYRLVRVGLGTIIAHIGEDGGINVVYRSGTVDFTPISRLSRAAWSITRNER